MRAAAGHVYVIAFDNGEVKVGRTTQIKVRVGQHDWAARKRGLAITDRWESPIHAEWDINEETLKRAARMLGGTPVNGTSECFTGLKWAEVADIARRLPFTPPSEIPPRPKADRRRVRISEHEKGVRLYALGIQVREAGTEDEKDSWERSSYAAACDVRKRPAEAA